ncbi:MAG TPA: lysophospholipid acyltransferase family protein [Steroidobacteraceae bacterium]|nr:lysophospholipid acyltransferase family protein [Steroidobacteraceae bacterium]
MKLSGAAAVVNFAYAAYCLVSFTVLGLAVLAVNLFLPGLRARRVVAGTIGRVFLRMSGIPFSVQGLERLPRTPCVVVANHASYIDAIAIVAALPPDFAFVIKKEMVRVPLASLLLRRLGSQFVERFDRHKGASDARRVLKLAATGQSLMFFPEGTFDETRQIGKFLGGAFTIAARAQMPVVAVAIHGTRRVMPPGSLRIHRLPIRVEILAVLGADEARLASRELIARAVGDPLAP